MIRLDDIRYSYDREQALKSISLEIKPKEKVVLLGSNGSGKSTLLRIMAGLYFCDGYYLGDMKVNKKSANKAFRQKVGILFQNPESMILNPTVYDEIAFSLREFDIPLEDKVETIAKKFGITHLLSKNPLNLSGGEKQKVMLASILVYEPEVILLDEPTAAMDPKTTGWFIDMLLELDTTLILATHDLSLAYETSDKSIVLNDGEIIYQGEIEKLFENKELLIQANLIHSHKHKHKKFIHSHYHLHF